MNLSGIQQTTPSYTDETEHRYMHQTHRWTKEENLDLIKYFSIKESWAKVKRDNFPTVSTECLRSHYFYLLEQENPDPMIVNQFNKFPTPVQFLKKVKSVKPICKVRRNHVNQIKIYEQDLELIKRVAMHGSWENLKQNIVSETNFALIQERYAFLLTHKYSHELLFQQLENYPPPIGLKLNLIAESSEEVEQVLFSNLKFAQQDPMFNDPIMQNEIWEDASNPSYFEDLDQEFQELSEEDCQLISANLEDWFSKNPVEFFNV